jgi:hypothetical protein
MLVPTYDVERIDRLIEAREGLEQDVLAQKLSSDDILQYYKSILHGRNISTQESSFWHTEKIFAQLGEQVEMMRLLSEDWDSYGAPIPTPATTRSAEQALKKLRSSMLLPETIAPSAEGGIAIYFASGSQKAFIEFLNEGDVVFARYGKDDQPNVRVLNNGLQDLDDQVLQEIRDHLGTRR